MSDICPCRKCNNEIAGEQVMCQPHWDMVNPVLKDRIAECYGRLADEFKMFVDKAIANAEQIEALRKLPQLG